MKGTIAREWATVEEHVADVLHLIHRQPIPTTQENPVTTPQQPASVVDSLHAITGEIQANGLVARLVQYRAGSRLSPSQADLVFAQVTEYEKQNAAIDQARAQLAAQQHDDAQQQQQ